MSRSVPHHGHAVFTGSKKHLQDGQRTATDLGSILLYSWVKKKEGGGRQISEETVKRILCVHLFLDHKQHPLKMKQLVD